MWDEDETERTAFFGRVRSSDGSQPLDDQDCRVSIPFHTRHDNVILRAFASDGEIWKVLFLPAFHRPPVKIIMKAYLKFDLILILQTHGLTTPSWCFFCGLTREQHRDLNGVNKTPQPGRWTEHMSQDLFQPSGNSLVECVSQRHHTHIEAIAKPILNEYHTYYDTRTILLNTYMLRH